MPVRGWHAAGTIVSVIVLGACLPGCSVGESDDDLVASQVRTLEGENVQVTSCEEVGEVITRYLEYGASVTEAWQCAVGADELCYAVNNALELGVIGPVNCASLGPGCPPGGRRVGDGNVFLGPIIHPDLVLERARGNDAPHRKVRVVVTRDANGARERCCCALDRERALAPVDPLKYRARERTMAGTVRRTPLILLAGIICAFAAGCGGDSEGATTAARPAAPPNLERFLLQNDEIPGFDRVESPQVDSSEESFAQPTGGLQELRSSGFVTSTFQPIVADNGNAGLTNVVLFETEAGAREWMAYETSDEAIANQLPGAKIKRFEVPDVPGAHGYTALDLHGNPIGHVYWTQGRCMMIIGDEGRGPFPKPLSTGAKAIYERTNGECP